MAFFAFIVSLLGGGFAACFNPGWGAVVSVSVMGALILHSLNKERSAAMSEFLFLYKDQSGISLTLNTLHETPAAVGRALGTVLSSEDWEGLLRYYLKQNAPEILEAIRSTAAEPGVFKALFAPDAEPMAVRFEQTLRSLVADGTELRRLLREEYDEIWPDEED